MRYVLVTGAYGGMGYSTIKKLKKQGYFVFALDKNLKESEENIMPIETDLTNIESIKNAFNIVKEVTDNLYAIIHYAGVYRLDSLVEMSEHKFTSTFDINLFGPFRINKIFLPLLSARSKIIITTSELAPLDPLPFTGIYAITKSALEKYAYSLRMELQLLNIDVIVLRPGAVKTSLLEDSMSELDKFCNETKLYNCNAKRFKNIVNRVETRHVDAGKISLKISKILKKRKPKFIYKINRNPLLLMLNILPKKWQTKIIKFVLK